MKIDFYERFFLGLTAVTLVIFFGAVIVSAFATSVTLPSPQGRVDPNNLDSHELFSAPGLRELAPNRYEVIMIAQAWQFNPREISVPAGSTVTFKVASRDVIHGFEITGAAANMMLIPGQVAVATVTFDTPGEHLIICHEYCGVGHQTMFATIFVEATEQAQVN